MKKRILVVDDEPMLLSMLVDFCEDLDVVSIPAENGTQALEKAASEKPDAVTVDYRMPDMTGMDVIMKLKANEATKGIPVILLSADAKMHEVEAKKQGAFGVLQKPVTRAGLRQMLEGCVGTW
ncbi:MAG TPA: response regulator [Elusimicrobiota bacterium]|nr:response regulator [Elusimicrobiota bacterium]